MKSDLLGENILEKLATAVARDVVAWLTPGSNVAEVLAICASSALFGILSASRPSEQQEVLDLVARVPPARSWEIAARRVAGTDLPDNLREIDLVKYLAAVPMSARAAIQRHNDGGKVTTLLSQLPRDPEETSRFLPVRPPLFQPGHKIDAHDWVLDTLLGQGGFGEVWKAHNAEVPREQVALKFCRDNAYLASLKREIDLLSRLGESEKDFVQLRGTAFSANPPFLVYDYVDGGNLCGWVEGFQGRAPDPASVITILKMTARAVHVAHRNDIVHRDLKPSNLLLTRDGRIKVADLGIGVVMSEFADRGSRSRPAELTICRGAFTPMYVDGLRDPRAPPHPRDDVYAIGVVAFQLLLGNLSGRMTGAWQQHLELRGIKKGLIGIVETCVAHPERRFRDAGAVLAALEGLENLAILAFCHQCGSQAAPGIRFCHTCGYRYP